MSRYVDPQDFRDVRRFSDLTRKQAADLLDVTVRTVQNWETGGARIPWMAYRMLRILKGSALPGKAWEGWHLNGDKLIAPNGRWFDADLLGQVERVYAMARLWREDYAKKSRRPAAVVLPFQKAADAIKPLVAHLAVGGDR
ncbi:MAG: VC1465 family Xer recombination activation factor [Gallionella sp.]